MDCQMQTWDIAPTRSSHVMSETLKDRLKKCIAASEGAVFLRKDFWHLGSYRQVSRALDALQTDEIVVRAGYGVYLRPDAPAVQETVQQVRARLGRRVKRHLTIAGITIAVGVRHAGRTNAQSRLDERKLATAKLLLARFTIGEIRRKSLANLQAWHVNGTWVSASEEWRALMASGSDAQIIAVMTGRGENANRLRQSPPYVGLLAPGETGYVH